MGKLGDKTGNGDANQRSTPLLEHLPDPPDPPRVPFSSMALCNQDAGKSTVEHSLATKKEHISKRVSTIAEVSESIAPEAADSSTCVDWRRNCRLKGEQIAWEPPVRAMSSTKPMHVSKLTDTTVITRE